MSPILNKCCFFVSNDSLDQATFTRALLNVSPETLCFTTPSGEDALYMITKEFIKPDFIFIELDMPGMDCLDFLKELKIHDDYKDINVIVHASDASPHKILQIKEFGAFAIYRRPYEYFSTCNMLSIYFSSRMPVFQLN